VVLPYGKLIQSVIDLIIVAFAIFMEFKAINHLKREEAVGLVNSNLLRRATAK
jgi:large conductance mechanosensitive channel